MSPVAPHARLHPGDRVALLVPATAAYVETTLALLTRGVVPIPLDPRLTEHERRRILDGLEPTVVVTDEDHLADLLAAHRPDGPITDWLPRARPMHCTSGTTGTPKGVWSGLLDDEDARGRHSPSLLNHDGALAAVRHPFFR